MKTPKIDANATVAETPETPNDVQAIAVLESEGNPIVSTETPEVVGEEISQDVSPVVETDETEGETDDETPENALETPSNVVVPAMIAMSIDDIEGDGTSATAGETAKEYAAVLFVGDTIRGYVPTTKIKPAYNAAMKTVKDLRDKGIDMKRNPAEFRNVGRNWIGRAKNGARVFVEVREVTGLTAADMKPEPTKPTYQSAQ